MVGALIAILIFCCLVWIFYYFASKAPRTSPTPRTETLARESSEDEPVLAAIAEEVVGQVVGALIESAVQHAVGGSDDDWVVDYDD